MTNAERGLLALIFLVALVFAAWHGLWGAVAVGVAGVIVVILVTDGPGDDR